MRRIAHVDMDAFFAAIELLRHPELRGRPLVVGGAGDATRRGVVSAASYEARRFGVRSGMALRTALRRCPEAVFLPVDLPAYRAVSQRILALLRELSPEVEPASIDEAYVDLSQAGRPAREIAQEIKRRILEETQLSCSVGVGPNKLLAKIASDLEKPDGLTVLAANDLEARVWPLPVRKLPGVGPKREATLARMGVHTIGELARVPRDELVAHFGRAVGEHLHAAARGIDESPLVSEREPHSLGREHTFEVDTADRDILTLTACGLATQVAERARREGYRGHSLAVKVRFADFGTHSHATALSEPSADPQTLRRAALDCLGRFTLVQPVRLLGVRLGSLEKAEPAQPAARLLVTARGLNLGALRRAQRAVEHALPRARVHSAGFGGILWVETEGEATELAAQLAREAAGRVGRVVAVLAEVESREEPVRDAAVRLAPEHIGPGDSFRFRIHKRGRHGFARAARELEVEIGGAIWEALERRDGQPPRVDLVDPDVRVTAEVLGPVTVVGVSRRG